MKLVIDDKIPYIREAAKQIANEIIYRKGSEINSDDIRDADALIIRTRTHCNESLLRNSNVKFIATATIGYDHIDTAYLSHAGIAWSNCPGCNATSVGQYLHSCLLLLQKEKGYQLDKMTIGLIGAGHVGTAVKSALSPLGIHTLLYDPPKEREAIKNGENSTQYHTLSHLMKYSDIISFHTPLTKTGEFPTFHMADQFFFSRLEKKPLIINTSRGEVIDTTALLDAIRKGLVRDAIIDTWENEPHINEELLRLAYLGTPHIAGYSADGKANASRMAIEAVCRFFHLRTDIQIHPPKLTCPSELKNNTDKEELALRLYNPQNDSNRLKQHPELFERLRENYPLRREYYDN